MSAAGFDLPSLLAAGAGPGDASTGADAYSDPAEQQDPLAVLQECLNALPRVVAALPDPQDTHDAIDAMRTLAKIQTRLMTRNANGSPPPGR